MQAVVARVIKGKGIRIARTLGCHLLVVVGVSMTLRAVPNSNYNLRQADFSIARYETVTYGKHSIRYLGPRLWTKLPKSIRDVTTLMSFKGKIRQINISELLDDGCAGCSLCSS